MKPINIERTTMKPALLLAVLAAGLLAGCGKNEDASAPAVAPASASSATNLPAPAAAANAAFAKLQGKWLRPDGGYILEIRSATAEGKLDAGYFNPRPIHVAKAEASQEGAVTKVFIELRDVNYPGSTYTLVYTADKDQLTGIYYQAAMQQQFDVNFVRTQ